MIQEFSAYPDWKAPAEDSHTLIWPDPARIVQDTLDNHLHLNAWSSPLAPFRARQRKMLKLSEDRPAIATGHQTELFHPGVWAKLAMIESAARKLDADSLFAAVDGDAPKHLHLRWPGKTLPITDDPRLNSAPWSGVLDSPSEAYIGQLKASLSASAKDWSFSPMAGEFLDDLAAQSSHDTSLSAALTAAMYRLDFSLGLRHQSLLTSRLWANAPYLAFVHYLLARADSFAGIYNQALAEYRSAHGIDNPGRPMPDLHVEPDRIEASFWLDDLAARKRERAFVHRHDGQWGIEIGNQIFTLPPGAELSAGADRLGEFLTAHNLRLAPRALTLTMFLRLFVVDQFVHGIGGGRYEQVNDRVIQRFFDVDPPAFCVTTATLYFPDAVGRERTCLPCLAHEGHRLRHAVLGSAKMDLVRQIAQLPRHSTQRQQLFSQMHTRLAETVQISPSVRTWRTRMSDALLRSQDEQGLFDRELFYAIQPRERLEALIEEYRRQF